MPKNLVVLVGAGASYDCHVKDFARTANAGYRPPLTSELFSPRPEFQLLLNDYPLIQPDAAAFLGRLRRDSTSSIEKYLRELEERTAPIFRQRSLLLGLYLQRLFHTVSNSYLDDHHGRLPLNAYTELVGTALEAMENGKLNSVTFLTTNYDTVLDRTLSQVLGATLTATNHYLNFRERWSLVKFHGSCDWWYAIDPYKADIRESIFDGRIEQRTRKAIDSGVDLRRHFAGADIHVFPTADRNQSSNAEVFYPALAIPVDRKYGAICPPSHTKHLAEVLGDTKSAFDLLVLGFSCLDLDVLDAFRPYWGKNDKLGIVNGNTTAGKDADARLQASGRNSGSTRNSAARIWDCGFQSFVLNKDGLRSFIPHS